MILLRIFHYLSNVKGILPKLTDICKKYEQWIKLNWD